MHACRFDFSKSHDAAREFAFEGALIVDLLLKIRESEICSVENLETDSAAFRQSLTGKLDSHFGQFVGRNLDGSAVRWQARKEL